MIRVYIHGRPQGQDIWSKSPNPNDEFYLKPFLGLKIGENTDAVLQVDMWQQNSYYSYIHRQNVVEKSNRPNAYFAITICFEKQYCTQVSTLYNLLEAIYMQLCLNNLIEKNGNQEHFLITQFQEKESVLLQITNIIQQNIEKFISNSLEPIEKKNDTTSAQIKSYATVDVDSPQFISDCQTYRVLIAPSFTSKDRLPQELQQQIATIESQKAELQKEKDRWQSDAEHSHEVNAALTKSQKEQNELITKLETHVNSITEEVRKEYSSRIEQLEKDLNAAKDDADKLNAQLSEERSEKSKLSEQLENFQNNIIEPSENATTESDNKDTKDKSPSNAEKLKYWLHRIEERNPQIWGKLAFAFSVVNTVLVALLIVVIAGNTKSYDNSTQTNTAPNSVKTEEPVDNYSESTNQINDQDHENQQ